MTTASDFKGSEEYGASYYGMMLPAKANYIGYAPQSEPHWALPLASILKNEFTAPVLDVGCAYGHLVRDINRIGGDAKGIDWSPWTSARFVSSACERADARDLPFEDRTFGTVVSLDLLEHFSEEGTERVLQEMVRVLQPKGWFVHLVGAHNPEDALSNHMSDPTHENHQDLRWYENTIRRLGFRIGDAMRDRVREHPAWAATDWYGRFIVAQSTH